MILPLLIGQHLVGEWADELALKLGRPASQIRERGLSASDFPGGHELHITLTDGSFAQFRYAFYVASDAKPGIAVFTEHCGYHLFPSADTVIQEVITKPVYPIYPHRD